MMDKMCKIDELKELLKTTSTKKILGQYYSNSFLIELCKEYSFETLENDTKGLSTFLHEYIHFLQNILTPMGTTGLGMNFIYQHNFVYYFNEPQNTKYLSEIYNAKKWMLDTHGDASTEYDINENIPIDIFGNILTIKTKDGNKKTIELGVSHVYEAMTYLAQLSLFKDTVINKNIPNPYELLLIIMATFFSNIKKITDIQLMYIFEWSLHHSEPVIFILNIFDEINKNSNYIKTETSLKDFLINYHPEDLINFHYSDLQLEATKFLKGDLLKDCREWLLDVLEKAEDITNNQDFPITDFFIDYKTNGISALTNMITNKIGCPQIIWEKGKYMIDQSILNSNGIYYQLIDNAIRLVLNVTYTCDIQKYCNVCDSGCGSKALHVESLKELCPLACIIKNFGLFEDKKNE